MSAYFTAYRPHFRMFPLDINISFHPVVKSQQEPLLNSLYTLTEPFWGKIPQIFTLTIPPLLTVQWQLAVCNTRCCSDVLLHSNCLTRSFSWSLATSKGCEVVLKSICGCQGSAFRSTTEQSTIYNKIKQYRFG